MSLRDTFARNLRRLRNDRGMSQEELADAAGLDRTYISSLERSVYAVSIDKIQDLAKALKVDPAEFLAGPRKGPAKQ